MRPQHHLLLLISLQLCLAASLGFFLVYISWAPLFHIHALAFTPLLDANLSLYCLGKCSWSHSSHCCSRKGYLLGATAITPLSTVGSGKGHCCPWTLGSLFLWTDSICSVALILIFLFRFYCPTCRSWNLILNKQEAHVFMSKMLSNPIITLTHRHIYGCEHEHICTHTYTQ